MKEGCKDELTTHWHMNTLRIISVPLRSMRTSTQATKAMQNLSRLLVLIAVFALGGWLAYRFLPPRPKGVENASVLLEQIRTVAKLSTVEGEFSEIYNYDEYQGYFTFFWDKKVLVRVRATVAAGYNLEKMTVEADAATHTIRIRNVPAPEILSIDHSLDYYDISTGIFTNFTEADYNRIHQRAKDLIREQAERSTLLQSAREQGDKIFGTIRFLGESNGWKVDIETPSPSLWKR